MPYEGSTKTPQTTTPGGRIFYGWYIVAAVFVIQTFSCGLIFYNLSIFLKAFVSQNGFSVTAASTATACFFLSGGMAGLTVGWLIDRYDPRYVMTGGGLLSALALVAAGYVDSLWQLYGFYILFGIGNAAIAVVPGTTLVARWFSRQRSRAIAFSSTGLSLGGIIFTPISVYLIEWLGLGQASQWLALMLILGTLPIAWIMLRPSPASMGLAPDGDPPRRSADGSIAPPDGIAYGEAIRSRFFILFTAAYVFSMMAQVGSLAHQFRLVATRTGDDHTAALAISIMAAASICGRLFGGFILSRIESKSYLIGIFVLQGISFTGFAFAQHHVALFVISAMFGATVGNIQMMMPLMVAEAFGLKAYARILSLSQMIITCAMAAGPALLGFLYQYGGGYHVAYLVITGASVIGLTLLFMAGDPAALLKQADREVQL
ncbi:MAG: MFS transporter [Rhizobiales bacterium]|nr:MFS transporter [Hyphomicrobiales bacterium]